MTQYWANLDVVNVTELKNNNTYYLGSSKNIVHWNSMHGNFVCYMPDSHSFVSPTTSIQFHDCYKVGDTGYAHASFAFNCPGYYANFPISVGFAGVNEAGSVWVIGQKQVLTYCTSAPTTWHCTLETSYGWPTEAMGVVPFIALGGVPFGQRYSGSNYTGNVSYYTTDSNTTLATYSANLVSVSNASSVADDFASNCFGITYNTDRVSPGTWSGKALCPYASSDWSFCSNWNTNADSTFIGGWHNRESVYPEGYGGAHTGVGFVFCGRPIVEGGSYTSWPSLSTAPFVSTTKVWVFNSSGVPQKAKQVYVYNSSGVPVKAKGLWVYNSSGKPVRVF